MTDTGDDSDDDKPILMTLLKSKADKLASATAKIKLEGAEAIKISENAIKTESTKSDALSTSKSSSSSSVTSSDKASAAEVRKAPEETSKSKTTKKSTEDSDDDLPISELMKRRLRIVVKAESKSKSESAPATKPSSSSKKIKVEESDKGKKKIEEKKKEPVAEKKSSTDRSSDKAIPPGLGSEFYETKKGMIAQRLLCRWWYAIDWPRIQDIGTPPPGYEALEGFLGVFASTRTDSLGNILDLRNKSTAPCLINFAKMDIQELKNLCITAYEKQMLALVHAEGEDIKLLGALKGELKEVKAVGIDKAEKEARKYITGDFSK